jgi:hypothetical protein
MVCPHRELEVRTKSIVRVEVFIFITRQGANVRSDGAVGIGEQDLELPELQF